MSEHENAPKGPAGTLTPEPGPYETAPATLPKGRAKPKKVTKRDRGTGAIYAEKDGGYRVRVELEERDPRTGLPKVVKRRAKTHAEAVRKLQELIAAKSSGSLLPPTKGSLASYLTEWLERRVRSTRAPRTYLSYKGTLDTFVMTDPIAAKRLEDVRPADVQGLLDVAAARPKAYGKGETVSRRQVEYLRAVLRNAMNQAVKDRLLTWNPVASSDVPTAARRTARRTAAPMVDVLKVLAIAEEDAAYGPLFLFLAGTGARVGEACAVRWEDLDLAGGRVRFGGQIRRVKGEGLVRSDGTKTGGGRTIPLPAFVLKMLQSLKASRMVDAVEHPEGYVFLNSASEAMDPRNVTTRLARFCRLAGAPVFSPHILRHCATTYALEAGESEMAVARMIGHSTPRLTRELYGHVTEGLQRGTADALDRAYRPSKPAKK